MGFDKMKRKKMKISKPFGDMIGIKVTKGKVGVKKDVVKAFMAKKKIK